MLETLARDGLSLRQTIHRIISVLFGDVICQQTPQVLVFTSKSTDRPRPDLHALFRSIGCGRHSDRRALTLSDWRSSFNTVSNSESLSDLKKSASVGLSIWMVLFIGLFLGFRCRQSRSRRDYGSLTWFWIGGYFNQSLDDRRFIFIAYRPTFA